MIKGFLQPGQSWCLLGKRRGAQGEHGKSQSPRQEEGKRRTSAALLAHGLISLWGGKRRM
jgi:hypothetical protein